MSTQDLAATPPPVRPRPELDHVSRSWWEATERGELLYQECPACGNRQHYPRALCTACGRDVEWRPASGRGAVHTFTVIRQNHTPPFNALVPYVVAMIDLDEGVRMMGNITGCAPDDVHVGLPVVVHFEEQEPGYVLPLWQPAGAAGAAGTAG